MAGAINLTEVDFNQIKNNLINYLKSTGQFTDYDFDGSNLQVILNLISYQSQLNAYSTNMVANESFLSSASLRNNVVANAAMIGYVPTSARSSFSEITFQYELDDIDYPSGLPQFLQIEPGPVFIVGSGETTLTFNLLDLYTAPVSNFTGLCIFDNIPIYEGTYLTTTFTVDDTKYDQKFQLENDNIDTTSIRVEVQEDPNQDVSEPYVVAKNLVEIDSTSRVYWLNEVDEGYYRLIFGDGYFGKKLQNGAIVTVSYLISSGSSGNGVVSSNFNSAVSNYSFRGTTIDQSGTVITDRPTVTGASTSEGGAEVETSSSVKFRAPREYATQNRCVVAEDYESIVRQIFPAVDDIYVFGGEEMDIPQYGRVYVVIKPTSGVKLSNLTKKYIKSSLDDFRIASLDIVIVDPDVLYVEVITNVFYDDKKTNKDPTAIVATVTETLSNYADSSTVSKFGGAVRYSRVVGAIDDSDLSITRNNTEFRMRKDMTAILSTAASYEICFENQLKNESTSSAIYSSGFQQTIDGVVDTKTYYFEDDGEGLVYSFYLDEFNQKVISNKNFGTVDYSTGEVKLGYDTPITIVSTTAADSIVQIRAVPFYQDIIADKIVYADLDVGNSTITATVDTQIAGS